MLDLPKGRPDTELVEKTRMSHESDEPMFSADHRVAVWQEELRRVEAGELPPNWKDPPKRHHYVPEFYLKRFAAMSRAATKKRKATYRICRVERRSGQNSKKLLGVSDAAVETDFYSIETADHRRVAEAEHMIGVFETAASFAFANFDSKGRDYFPDTVDRENLAHFMALQFVRGPQTVALHEEVATKASRMILRMVASSPDRVRSHLRDGADDPTDEAVASAVRSLRADAETIEVTPHRNVVVGSIFSSAKEFVPYFLLRNWTVVRTPIPLLTSDQPIVLWSRGEGGSKWGGIGLATAEAIVYPLDRHRALILRDPDFPQPESVMDVSVDVAHTLNAHIANKSRRWVFHHPADEPLRDITYDASRTTRGSSQEGDEGIHG